MKATKRQATRQQVMDEGDRIKMVAHAAGGATEWRELDGIVFEVHTDADGYIDSFWCMGRARRVAREYGIER